MIKQIMIGVLIVISSVLSIFAQNTNWGKVKNVSLNEGLIVEMKSGKTIAGYVVSVNDSEITLKDKKGETKLDKADIKQVFAGIQKHKIPFWVRTIAGVGTFVVTLIGLEYVLVKNGVDEVNSLEAAGLLAAATTATVVVTKNLSKLKSLKKGWLIYQEP
jgi:hypothetical protein